ncbi:MAG: ABC transporter permease [candidate division SR1 bacterium]|nr:ABC transporter permease [candidate division SR1 bacterium]
MFIKTKALFLILQKHLLSKWGRVLLAQAGIMIGVWAISLTSSLSLGLSDKIVTAINSQPSSREISIYKSEKGDTNFFQVSGPPKFVFISKQEIQNLTNTVSGIDSVSPTATLGTFTKKPSTPSDYNCVDKSIAINHTPVTNPSNPTSVDTQQIPANPEDKKIFSENCYEFRFSSSSYQAYFDNHRTKLIGSQNRPQIGEISICYKCGDLNLNQKIGVNSPSEMIGKNITIDVNQTPGYLPTGSVYDTASRQGTTKTITKSNPITLKIVSVVDDSQANNNPFATGGQFIAYLDFSYYENAIKQFDPSVDLNKIGYISADIAVTSYDKLDNAINQLQGQKYLTLSATQFLISGVKTLFTVLTYFLAGFGLIVLISSIFGIINVMTISVLERRKEIGIIKSLGGNDNDIFIIFLLESIFLGIVGWLFGILLALGTGKIISAVVISLINSNPEWKGNLATFNINEFTPVFPWQLLAITFGLAVFFTSISGLIPSIRASKQNIVEVLRSE